MEMNNDLHNIFCSWNSKLEELAEYFQDKYNFDIDDEDLKATKETIMEIATDVPKIVSLALYCEDRTAPKKVEMAKAKGKTKTTEQISIVLNDKETAERILHKLHDFVQQHGGFDNFDIEILVREVTHDHDFTIETTYTVFTREEAYSVYMINKGNEYEIIFPPHGKAIALGCGKEE